RGRARTGRSLRHDHRPSHAAAPRAARGRPPGRGRVRAGRRPAPPAARPPATLGAVTRVAVLKGGRSLERGVSLKSGARVEDALQRLGHEPLPLDVGADLVERLTAERPDIAFIALHGPDGEDGTAQELLEILGIPYTGP